MPLLRWLWARRRLVISALRKGWSNLAWLYGLLPMGERLRAGLKELTYGGIEHLIVQSDSYQRWLEGRSGLTRLHHLFAPQGDTTNTLPPLPTAEAPPETAWQELTAQRYHSDIAVHVVIPVYRGYDETLCCLYSVLRAENETAFCITVIDDASPDPALRTALTRLHEQGMFDLITHERNQGFVRTANEGMYCHDHGDVILLNSDTEVYDGWIDRLRNTATQHDSIASVTPLSNNAEICSYPAASQANDHALECSGETLNALTAQVNPPAVEIPTAVGFCMYMTRQALDDIGGFDADSFDKGYGEENDWCLRAAAKGYVHLCATNTYVLHRGGRSFGKEKSALVKKHLKILNRRYPHYRELIRDFKIRDPLFPARRALDMARLAAVRQPHSILMISHCSGGGTETHIQDLSARLGQEQISTYRLSPDQDNPAVLQLWHPDVQPTPNNLFSLDDDQDQLIEALCALNIHHMHLHHLHGFAIRFAEWLPQLAERLDAQYDVTMHDYAMICPSINLLCHGDIFQGNPSVKESQHYADTHHTAAGRMPVWQWQAIHNRLLSSARHVFTPSHDTAGRVQHYYPALDVYPKPHPEIAIEHRGTFHPRKTDEVMKIACIGALTRHKGAKVILQLAQDAQSRNLPIRFHIFGEAAHEYETDLLRTERVTIHGRYQDDDIYHWLERTPCHAALFASIWPETYSYSLSIALNALLFPIAFDLGAPAERIRTLNWGELLPVSLADHPAMLNDQLLSLSITPPPETLNQWREAHLYPSIMDDYYQLSLSKHATRSAG